MDGSVASKEKCDGMHGRGQLHPSTVLGLILMSHRLIVQLNLRLWEFIFDGFFLPNMIAAGKKG